MALASKPTDTTHPPGGTIDVVITQLDSVSVDKVSVSDVGLSDHRLAELYDTQMNTILDGLIPSRPVVRRPRSSDAWYDYDCRQAKHLTRRFERAYAAAVRRSSPHAAQSHGSASVTSVESAKEAWYAQRRNYRD